MNRTFTPAFLLITGFLLLTLKVFSQATEETPKKIRDPKDRIVVDLDYDTYLNMPAGISQKPYSLGAMVLQVVWG